MGQGLPCDFTLKWEHQEQRPYWFKIVVAYFPLLEVIIFRTFYTKGKLPNVSTFLSVIPVFVNVCVYSVSRMTVRYMCAFVYYDLKSHTPPYLLTAPPGSLGLTQRRRG